MHYVVYLKGPNALTHLLVQSEEVPQVESHGRSNDVIAFGGMFFSRQDVVAIVPRNQLASAGVSGLPRK